MTQNSIFTFAKWQIKEDNLETVLSLLKEVVVKSSAEEGNLKYEVYQGNENTLMLFEAYKDQQALDDHRNSAYFREVVMGKIIPLLENREVLLAHMLFP